ncbi:hypothetical protein EGR_05378 [Echinococcus granulosus]|uniref:Uncharacterized protein n=1 Tax=Echinococcus granulosus TaxID=6210 RepID=W6UF76_ECHGR|nr:hypothetical protein EGR_05378 [Echinococcus granulosus]EUB59758.1 hypothetical protein EGR_05378 [Echinococcus granulosus]
MNGSPCYLDAANICVKCESCVIGLHLRHCPTAFCDITLNRRKCVGSFYAKANAGSNSICANVHSDQSKTIHLATVKYLLKQLIVA